MMNAKHHTGNMQVVDAGAVVLLVLCVQEPELSLKRVATSALSDIAKHTPELAQAVVDAGMATVVFVLIRVDMQNKVHISESQVCLQRVWHASSRSKHTCSTKCFQARACFSSLN